MESLITNSKIAYNAIKKSFKSSFINLIIKSKWYNKKENLSFTIQVGCVRSSQRDTRFTEKEIDTLMDELNSTLGSYEIKDHHIDTVKDKKTNKNFEILEINFNPIEF